MYVGMASGVDALAPFVDDQELTSDRDAQRNSYRHGRRRLSRLR